MTLIQVNATHTRRFTIRHTGYCRANGWRDTTGATAGSTLHNETALDRFFQRAFLSDLITFLALRILVDQYFVDIAGTGT